MKINKEYDVVVLGATGFTGQFVLEELMLNARGTGGEVRVCAAARDEERLDTTIKVARVRVKSDVDVHAEIVDVNDLDKLEALASKTKILLSCVGPYRKYGHQVALACVKGGADYLDISGEPEFLEAVQAKLNAEAKAKGVHMVGSCGFDSVPADVGTLMMYERFPGQLSHVEMIAGHEHVDGKEVPIHATTMECAVMGYANRKKLRTNRAIIMPKSLPLPPYKPPPRSMLWYDQKSYQWCVANLGSDKSVVMRSQYLLHSLRPQFKPIHFTAYFGLHSFKQAFKAIMFGMIMMVMCNLSSWTRSLLIKYPSIFSLGMFTFEGPERKELKEQSFCMTLTGKGWAQGSDTTSPPNLVRHLRVRGPDPAYFGTAIIAVQCALTMLRQKDALPSGGGVFTPAVAFANTDLVKNLLKRGVTFNFDDPDEHSQL
ncbi:Saccharopine dehydrogenase NADP binding domain [Trinorchestia longiramus]|nr:Saccharopine dehydrogenase NADP binding domain [Trinorchestia longiramus]